MEPDFGVEKIEMYLGPSLGVVVYAEFEFSNENRIGAHIGVVLGELLIWYFFDFSIFWYLYFVRNLKSFEPD